MSESNGQTGNHFRKIGEVADATDSLMDSSATDAGQSGTAAAAGEEEFHPVEQVESLCMNCHENGTTSLLLAHIPFFKEQIIMSFRCDHCGFANNEIQSAGQTQELGTAYTVKIMTREDLNRQLVKGEHATLQIPEYELTLPPGKGQLTTVESIISATIADLEFEQPARRTLDPPTYEKIEALLAKLRPIVDETKTKDDALEKPFTVKLEDPSGNSFIEAKGGFEDAKWSKNEFRRTAAQNEQIGLASSAQQQPQPAVPAEPKTLTDDYEQTKPDEVISFPDVCSSCGATLETYMKTVDIPHFKEVVLMSTNCHTCGYRDNEIKSGGAVANLGRKITLKVEDRDDLSRDILKSETAGLTIPEIDLHLHPGTLGGRFTTLEGLLQQVYEELDEKVFARGDSAAKVNGELSEMEIFLQKLKRVRDVAHEYTIILDDPLSNSYIQNLYAPDPDPNMESVEYERDFEQNEDLGLNDMHTEGYHGEEEAKKAREEADRKTERSQEQQAEQEGSVKKQKTTA